MQNEGGFFLALMGFLFVLWAYTGGPHKPISYSGVFITPITGIGQTQVGYGPKLTINKHVAFGDLDPNASTTPREYDSPYSSLVSVTHGSDAAVGSEKADFIQISISPSAGKDVDVTGWKITSDKTGASATIPQGVLVLQIGGKNSPQEVLLRPGDRANVASDASPVRVSFEENKCLGYLNSKQSLYNPCVAGHVKEHGFLTGNWFVYLGQSANVWSPSHDTVTLYDGEGKSVAGVSY
jgi:hypothetical protein